MVVHCGCWMKEGMGENKPWAEREPRRERLVTNVSAGIRASLIYTPVFQGVCLGAVLCFSFESVCHASQIGLELAT